MKSLLSLTLILSIQSAFGAAMHIGSGDICGVKNLSKSKGTTACVCEVMKKEEWNKNEYAFYKMGCGKWLNSQKCDKKITVDIKDNVDGFLSSISDLSNIKIGYVGHWDSAASTINYLKERVVPIVSQYEVPVFYDNTACMGASDPLSIRNFINSQPEHLQNKIIVKANQNISVGEWDSILKPFMTSNTEITMCSKGLQIPTCGDFNKRNCSVSMNEGDTTGCIDNKSNFRVFKCTDVKANRSGRFELGKWVEVDMSPKGSEIIETSLSELNPKDFATVWADTHITDPESLEEMGLNKENSAITDSRVMMIDYKTYHSQDTLAGQKDLIDAFGPFSWVPLQRDLMAEKAEARLLNPERSLLSIEDSKIYILKQFNKNLKNRMSRDRSKIEFFQQAKNPIMNYYHMYEDELETQINSNELARLLENLN